MDQSLAFTILFLTRKYYYQHKMSRVHFHAIKAIEKLCNLVYSGPEWENWDSSVEVSENIQRLYQGGVPDLVLSYRAEEIPGIAKLPIPTAIQRDELQTLKNPIEKTISHLKRCRIDLVISHQKKQLQHSLFATVPCEFGYIPYCADITIFKDYQAPKSIDALLVGDVTGKNYPLRSKLYHYMLKMLKDERFKQHKLSIYRHPGYRLKEAFTDKHVIDFAKTMNAAKICITCSGADRLKLAKYVEVPACRSLLMADMPFEDEDILKHYLAEIPENVTYDGFTEFVLYYLAHDEERSRLTDCGYSLVRERFTGQHYAKSFICIVRKYLSKYGGKKVWS